MRKRIVSTLLALCMALMLLPGTAWAGEVITVLIDTDGTEHWLWTYSWVDADTGKEWTTEDSGEGWSWNGKEGTLTLNGYTGKSFSCGSIERVVLAPGSVNTLEECYLGCFYDPFIIIEGNGKLMVTSRFSIQQYSGAVVLADQLEMTGGTSENDNEPLTYKMYDPKAPEKTAQNPTTSNGTTATYVRIAPAASPKPHTHTYVPKITEPSCMEQGYSTYTCWCGDSYKDDYTPAIGSHDFSEWTWEDGRGPDRPGTYTRYCYRCHYREYKDTPSTDPGEHTHTYNTVVTPPTCTEKGYTTYTCECGDTYRDNVTPAAGHNYGRWVVVQAATETHTGLQERTCGVCGNTQSETIPRLAPAGDPDDNPPSRPSRPTGPSKPAEKPAEPEKPTEPETPAVPETPIQPQEPVVSVPVYDDVTSDAWYHEAAAYVASKGIMTGTSENNFSPDAQMTRAMIWTVLGRMDGADVSSASGAWYAGAQAWSVEKGISDGANPNGSITRQELVTMLWRYTGSPAAAADLTGFADSANVADWAVGAMEWAVSSGIIQGSGNVLNPGSTATRAEAAAILMRFCESTQ